MLKEEVGSGYVLFAWQNRGEIGESAGLCPLYPRGPFFGHTAPTPCTWSYCTDTACCSQTLSQFSSEIDIQYLHEFSIQYKYLYLWLNLTYSSFCKDDLKHNFTVIEKSGQMHISIEVKTGNFFLGNGTN